MWRKPRKRNCWKRRSRGCLRNLDPHSSYLNQKNFKSIRQQTRGEFGGLGIEVTLDETGYVRVVAPIDDTPAFRAGIQAGDLIVELDGEAVQGLTLSEAVEKMRGEIGSDIILTIVRGDREPFEATVTRDRIQVRSVRQRLEGDVGYLRISSFTGQTQSGLERAIDAVKEEAGAELKGFILDLRSNPGGLLDQAISVSDTFLEKGEVVSTRGREYRQCTTVPRHPGRPDRRSAAGGADQRGIGECVRNRRRRAAGSRPGHRAGYPVLRQRVGPDYHAAEPRRVGHQADDTALLHAERTVDPAKRHHAGHHD